MPGDERRKHVRYPMTLTAEHEGESEWTENLSAGGLFVQSQRTVSTDQPVTITLGFPGLLPAISVAGRVAWSRRGSTWEPAGFGVEVTQGLDHLAELSAAYRDQEAVGGPTCRVLLLRNEHLVAVAGGQVDVVSVSEGAQAVERVGEGFDLVLTELFAPMPDCLRTIKKLQELSGDTPVIATAAEESDDALRAIAAGAAAVLPRVVKPAYLFRTVAALKSK